MVEDSGLSVHGHGSLCSVKIFQPGSECLIQKVLVVLAACLFSLDLCRCRPLSPSGRSTHACLWTRLCAGAHAHAAVLLARAVAVPLLGRLWRASPGPDRGVRDGARPVRCTRSSWGGGTAPSLCPGHPATARNDGSQSRISPTWTMREGRGLVQVIESFLSRRIRELRGRCRSGPKASRILAIHAILGIGHAHFPLRVWTRPSLRPLLSGGPTAAPR